MQISNCSFVLFIVASLLSGINSKNLFKNCPSNIGHIESINVTGCNNNDSYCRLKKGVDVAMNLTFISGEFENFFCFHFHFHLFFVLMHQDQATDSVKVKIFGEIARVQVPFVIEPE